MGREEVVNLPEYTDIRIRKTQDGKHEVLDVLRHRFVALTPEEWVRQHFVNYLVTSLDYPQALMANEVELRVGGKRLRCDSVLYDKQMQPRMIMEYKAESIPLTEKVVTQVMTYNILLHADYLIVSNGMQHLCLHRNSDSNRWEYLQQIPRYGDLV